VDRLHRTELQEKSGRVFSIGKNNWRGNDTCDDSSVGQRPPRNLYQGFLECQQAQSKRLERKI